MSEWIEGTLRRVVWAAPDSDYAVISLETQSGAMTVVGQLGLVLTEVAEGTFLAIEGRWETHATHGKQFRADGFLQALPRTLSGIVKYLSQAGIDGVGPKSAESIVAHFGLETLSVLSGTPERLKEVSGIGASRARVIGEQWALDASGHALVIRLRGLGLSNRVIRALKERYGEKAAYVVARHPYRLCEEVSGVGFLTADKLAISQGLDPSHPERTGAAILHALVEASRDGHCFLPLKELARKVDALGVGPEHISSQIDRLVVTGAVVLEEEERVWRRSMWRAEEDICVGITRLLRNEPEGTLFGDSTRIQSLVLESETRLRMTLNEDQRSAIVRAFTHPVSIITGGPGTGKTTLVQVLLDVAKELGEPWLLAAPTGRAARRMEESTGQQASTIHRLLEYQPPPMGFARNLGNPLQGDGLVIDESSMLDVELFQSLVAACPYDSRLFRLVLVGDVDQLPSVGPGRVLGDLMNSGRIPVTALTDVYRQEEGSGILSAARAVLQGDLPTSGEITGQPGFFVIPRTDSTAVEQTVLKVITERLPNRGYSPIADVQVLCPTRRGPLGTNSLNEILQNALNPKGEAVSWGPRQFRVGDRVICQRNKHDLDVYNGDLGTIITVGRKQLNVDFGGRSVIWERDDGMDIDLGYAITIHKSQGSEYPVVIALLHRSHSIMLYRNLVYTAFTRSREFLCVIGDPDSLRLAARRVRQTHRHTRLSDRLANRKHGDDLR